METTSDAFLNGDLQIIQPRLGHRSGMDAVMLAAHARIEVGESLADLGAGVGVAGFCVASRISLAKLGLFEINTELSEISRQNAENNGFSAITNHYNLNILERQKLPANAFDHVICNPPYNPPSMQMSENAPKRLAHEGLALIEWVKSAAHILRAKGSLTWIDRPERLPELLHAFTNRFGGVEITPLFSASDKPAIRLLISAKLGSNTPLKMMNAVYLP